MIPVVFDPRHVRIVLAGAGDALATRLRGLTAGGAGTLRVFAPDPAEGLAAAVAETGAAHVARLPEAGDLAGATLLFIAGLDAEASAALAARARAAGVPVNVEDRIALSDFHVPALVRRGDLLLTVSTGGRGPGLAVAIRERLERDYGPEWAARLDALAGARARWRAGGAGFAELRRRTREWLDRQGWFD